MTSKQRLSSERNLATSQSGTKSLATIINQGKTISRMKERKVSYGFGSVPGIRPMERTSVTGVEFKRPVHLYFPTYQLDTFYQFDRKKVRRYVEKIADEFFTTHVYSAQVSPQLALRFAAEVTRTVRNYNYNRYRIITVATIGEKRAQSYNNCISFLWDSERDDYVDVQRERPTAILQITVFGIYLD